MSQGRAYQLLRAARVVDECTTVHSLQVISESEAVARELAPLLNNPQALDEVWVEQNPRTDCANCDAVRM
jgi:hypothetical protein